MKENEEMRGINDKKSREKKFTTFVSFSFVSLRIVVIYLTLKYTKNAEYALEV